MAEVGTVTRVSPACVKYPHTCQCRCRHYEVSEITAETTE